MFIVRGLSTGIYTTNSPEACHYILENSRANIVMVENQMQLDKILKVIFHLCVYVRACTYVVYFTCCVCTCTSVHAHLCMHIYTCICMHVNIMCVYILMCEFLLESLLYDYFVLQVNFLCFSLNCLAHLFFVVK